MAAQSERSERPVAGTDAAAQPDKPEGQPPGNFNRSGHQPITFAWTDRTAYAATWPTVERHRPIGEVYGQRARYLPRNQCRVYAKGTRSCKRATAAFPVTPGMAVIRQIAMPVGSSGTTRREALIWLPAR